VSESTRWHNQLASNGDSSFLIRVLALKATDQKDVDGHLVGISLDELDQMTRLCFDELSVLRHRGAFSSVAQAFASCCQSMYTTGQHMVLIELYTVSIYSSSSSNS
jgi:hypothetical protein